MITLKPYQTYRLKVSAEETTKTKVSVTKTNSLKVVPKKYTAVTVKVIE